MTLVRPSVRSTFSARLEEDFKKLRKEYVKAMRGPKPKADPNDESRHTSVMQDYRKMRLRFKNKQDKVVKSEDVSTREQQVSKTDVEYVWKGGRMCRLKIRKPCHVCVLSWAMLLVMLVAFPWLKTRKKSE